MSSTRKIWKSIRRYNRNAGQLAAFPKHIYDHFFFFFVILCRVMLRRGFLVLLCYARTQPKPLSISLLVQIGTSWRSLKTFTTYKTPAAGCVGLKVYCHPPAGCCTWCYDLRTTSFSWMNQFWGVFSSLMVRLLFLLLPWITSASFYFILKLN